MSTSPVPRFPLSWLVIGLFSLAISGLFSIVVAVAWHPALKAYPIFSTLFHRSLVSHVNLSITVFFLCCLFLLWSVDTDKKPRIVLPYFDATARALMVVAILLMAAASFDPSAIAIMSNYVPVMEHPLFFLSIGCIVAASVIKWIEFALVRCSTGSACDIVVTGNHTSRAMLAVAFGAFAASSHALSGSGLKGEIFYEFLFWGGGHVLQFIWVQVIPLLPCIVVIA
jgi:cytochrome c oxidase subunit I